MDLRLMRWTALLTVVALADLTSGQHGSAHVRTHPCTPNPCGPNTICTVNREGIPMCWCLKGFTKNRNQLVGCTHVCKSNQDCPSESYCDGNECQQTCTAHSCAPGAMCAASNHIRQCVCPPGSYGDPYRGNGCTAYQPGRPGKVNKKFSFQQRIQGDPCDSECGANTVCTLTNGRHPVCSCEPGTTGNPYLGCQKVGDKEGNCPPNSCGENAECKMINGRARCKCPEGHYGNPLHRCTPECQRDADCAIFQACNNFRCEKVCLPDACVKGALCEPIQHRPVCKCPPGFMGSPQTQCYPECTDHSQCPDSKACINSNCRDPCNKVCGRGAICMAKDHKAVCSCPKGTTGHPFENCRPVTPEDVCNPNRCGRNAECKAERNEDGYLIAICSCPSGFFGDPLTECKRGNCVNNYDCPLDMACRSAQCINPCEESGCGIDASCKVISHRAYCSCSDGYTGNSMEQCFPIQIND